LPGWTAMSGERALFFRALAQQRRTMPAGWLAASVLVDLAAPLVLLAVAPRLIWAWTAVCVATTFWTAGSMLAVERVHYHLRLAPLRPRHALLWLGAFTALQRFVSIELAWLPIVFAPGVGLGAWIMGVVLIPCAVAFVEAAGALAVTTADRLLARGALKAALGIVGLLAGAAALGTPAWLGGPAMLGLPLAALALLIGGACCLARAADRLPRLNESA